MKIKPTIYAKLLIESAKSDNLKQIAANFWHMLQKNKQYKDLGRILEELEAESARAEGKVIAKVYSEKALDEAELKEIQVKLTCHFDSIRSADTAEKSSNKISPTVRQSSRGRDDSTIMVKNIVKPNTTGIVIKVEDKIIDLSIEDKINRLRKKFT